VDLYEVLPIFYGTHGREMKSTRINLITAWGGSATKGGYTCVQKPRYFQTTGGKATDPDEGVHAMQAAKFVICDEFKEENLALPFNEELVKSWCNMGGTPIPFEPKFGVRAELTPSWLMVWFTNVVPRGMRAAGEALKRRPLVHDVELVFVDDAEYEAFEEGERPHYLRIADSSVRENMKSLVDELDFVVRLLVPGLYMRKSVTKPRPVPPRFLGATEMALKEDTPGSSSDGRMDRDVVLGHMHARNKAAKEPNMSCTDVVKGLVAKLHGWDDVRVKKALKLSFTAKAVDLGGKKKGSGYFLSGKTPAEHWVLN
jgi:hypothetical protein